MFLLIFGGLAVFVILFVWGLYNSFITLRVRIKEAWSGIDVQLKRRADLIPNLVESVKGIMNQEQEVFGMIADARTKYAGAATVNEKVGAATEVESALSRLLVVMENYPELKSAENVNTLMAQLEGTENRISVERGRFNNAVRDYNVMVKRFPANVLAGMFGYGERNYFEAAKDSENAPSVKF